MVRRATDNRVVGQIKIMYLWNILQRDSSGNILAEVRPGLTLVVIFV